jgi:probable F420-dependent oxidoreductase
MKIDTTLHLGPEAASEEAARAEALGFDGAWIAETSHDPFLPLALASQRTVRLELATGIAVALARSPMTLAQTAWDLAALSKGRFILGLGSQIKAHIVRRFSMPWSQPVEQMREMVAALRTIWRSFQEGVPLKFEGQHYRLSLLTPFFNPGPIEHPRIPLFLAAVGPRMTALAGEVADGVLLHPLTHRRFFQEVSLPALEEGLRRAGRSRSEVTVAGPAFVITGPEPLRRRLEASVRQQIAFYGSTPAYAGVLGSLGHLDLHRRLHELSRRGQWEEMAGLIPADVLEEIAVVCPVEELGDRLRQRYQGMYDRLVLQLPLDDETARRLFAGLRASA